VVAVAAAAIAVTVRPGCDSCADGGVGLGGDAATEADEPPSARSGRFTRRSPRFDRLVKAADVPRIRLHDTRHTAATLMLEQGVPLKVVTERLGHSSTRITADLYQHASETMQDEAAARIGAVLLD